MGEPLYDTDPMGDGKNGKNRILQALGAHVRLLRKEKKLSQEALAEKCGISAKYLGEVERGKRSISLLCTLRLMQALDIVCEEEFFRFLPRRHSSRKHTVVNEFKRALTNGQVRIALLAMLNDQ